MSYPPTVIIVHPSERPSKCTVQPLRGDARFLFSTFTRNDPPDLSKYVRLGMDGPRLSRERDSECGLLVLDGTWRYAERMERAHADITARRLEGWKTAYPRTSKLFEDPSGGLATIEAIYAAYMILDRPTEGLMDHYRWREEFLALNGEVIASCSSSG